MRATETRITILLVTLVSAVVAAVYWLTVRQNMAVGAIDQWLLVRGIGVVGGTGLCIAIAITAIVGDMRRTQRRVLEQARQWALSTTAESLPAPRDADIQPFIHPLREKLNELRTRAESLAVQKKNLEIQLRLADSQRRQAEAMIHGISDAVIVTDAFDELMLANPAAAEIFKFTTEQGARRPVGQLLGDKASKLAADIADMRGNTPRTTGTNRRTGEYRLEVDGQMRTYLVTFSCVMDSTDQLSAVVTVLHDRTREDEISKMKTDFVSHVSHELRTPLSSIKAYAELLVDGEATDDKTRNEFYHIIQAEAERLSRLIDNILNISRIESGMMKISKKQVSLNQILKRVLEVAMPSAREKKIAMVEKISPVFHTVEADSDMIYQAALNLMSNAIKYTREGGQVTLALDADEEAKELIIRVTDTGVGIPAEAMKHLFEKFYRVEQNKGMAKGSGLGLNLTRQIIEGVHRGRMIVTSEVGKGSTFGFALPMAA
jgi:two-component system, OmpR family, phosphate regulon sensor histidine kinase PhoR